MYNILYLNLRFEFKASGYCAAKSHCGIRWRRKLSLAYHSTCFLTRGYYAARSNRHYEFRGNRRFANSLRDTATGSAVVLFPRTRRAITVSLSRVILNVQVQQAIQYQVNRAFPLPFDSALRNSYAAYAPSYVGPETLELHSSKLSLYTLLFITAD